jgi:hypothetical protein
VEPRIDYRRHAQQPLKSLLDIEKYLASSGLEEKLLHLIKMRAWQINGCGYLSRHAFDRCACRGNNEQRLYPLDAWHETSFFSDRERAALAWTEAVTLVSETHTPDGVFNELKKILQRKGNRRPHNRARHDQPVEPHSYFHACRSRSLPVSQIVRRVFLTPLFSSVSVLRKDRPRNRWASYIE